MKSKMNNKKYSLIYADPPWHVIKYERKKVRPNQGRYLDYPTMSVEEIKNLPVERLAEEICYLFMWTTQRYLPDAFEVMKAWGFNYGRTITWDKKNGICAMGFHHRTEFLLFGWRGKLDMFPKRKTVPTIFQISSKGLRHSEKPAEIRKAIEVFAGCGNMIELFAREKVEGWDCFGNEVEGSMDSWLSS